MKRLKTGRGVKKTLVDFFYAPPNFKVLFVFLRSALYKELLGRTHLGTVSSYLVSGAAKSPIWYRRFNQLRVL